MTLKPPSGCTMIVGGPEAFMPDAPAAETRIPLISDWSPNCCAEAPMKSAVRCMMAGGAGLDTGGKLRAERKAPSAKRNLHPPFPFTILSMLRLVCLLAFAVLASPLPPLRAQEPVRRVLPELRVDLTISEVTSAHAAAGVHITAGTYFRVAILAGAGRAWENEAEGDSYRFEVQGRFHLDPLRSTRFGLYGIGGVATTHDPFANWQSRLVIGAGVELPAHGRATLAIESALAGGLRLSIATRRVPLGRR